MGIYKANNQDYLQIVNVDLNRNIIEIEIYKNESSKDSGLDDFERKKHDFLFLANDEIFNNILTSVPVNPEKSLQDNIKIAAYNYLLLTNYKTWTNDNKDISPNIEKN